MTDEKIGFKPKFPTLKQHLIFWIFVSLLVAIDLWTKSLVFDYLGGLGGYKPILGDFLSFVARLNSGAAFSIASGSRVFLVAVSSVAFIVAVFCFELGMFSGRFVVLAAMFTAGIAGNLYDRIFNDGLVRDFVDINLYVNNYHWPTFNVADSLMCTSLGLYFIFSLLEEVKNAKHNEKD